MPKVNLIHHSVTLQVMDFHLVLKIGTSVQKLVAKAFSTDTSQLSVKDVDWIVEYRPRHYGSMVPIYSIEIEAIGYPERKKKLTDDIVRQLKTDILAVLPEPVFDPEHLHAHPSIWIKYIDPDGQHM